jgi:hypothetical protein
MEWAGSHSPVRGVGREGERGSSRSSGYLSSRDFMRFLPRRSEIANDWGLFARDLLVLIYQERREYFISGGGSGGGGARLEARIVCYSNGIGFLASGPRMACGCHCSVGGLFGRGGGRGWPEAPSFWERGYPSPRRRHIAFRLPRPGR